MLVLRRKRGQKLYIDGGKIVVEMLAGDHGWCKLGITAPRAVRVMREEACSEGPDRCCRCGGTLPPASGDGILITESTGCRGDVDPESGRCRALVASTLWGDVEIGPERKDGAA